MAMAEVEVKACPEGICDGSGEVERMEYECNDSTGYNTIAMPSGVMEPCPCTM